MRTFDTSDPISVKVEIGVGDVRVVATERADTVVDIQPSDHTNACDVAAAEQTRVDYANGVLTVSAPLRWTPFARVVGPSLSARKRESIDIKLQVPSGSHLSVNAALAPLRCSGTLGRCNYRTGAGDVAIGHVSSWLELSTGSGSVRVDRVDGPAKVRNGNGGTWIGEAYGALEVKAANGRIEVGHVGEAVTAKTANGDIHLDEVVSGVVVANTGFGNVDLGVRTGIATWLDLHTGFGHVRNSLDAAERPDAAEPVIELRARTSFGDVTVRRAAAGEGDRGAA
ncbi:MAG: DUF4097 family beta strand repeat-containing protein [Acidimicrobiales bacterium]